MAKVTAAHLLVRTLKRHGIERIFGLCGDHVNSIFNACIDEGVTVVDTRQEAAATHMADGWARVTGQPGVSVATGGPGHTNSITGIATAWLAGSPILAISGIPPPSHSEPAAAPARSVETALDLLARAERPVVIVGSGIWWARAWEALRRFIELTQLPCFTIGMGRGSLSDEHPLCLGYADQALNPVAREIKEADVILLIGKRIDFRLAYGKLFAPNAALIQIDIHAPELGKNRRAQLPIQADAAAVLEQLAERAEARRGWKEKPWVERLRRARRVAAEARHPDENSDTFPVHPLRIVKEVREAVNSDVVWSIDAGDFAQWCRIGLPARKPGHWLRLGALATVGAAIPFGIAAKLAKPDCPVVILTGDGGMGFHSWELHTALRFHAPVVVVVGNDHGWGMERELQSAFYDRTIGVELGEVRYDQVIAAMGGHGEHVEHPAELRPALERALKAGKAACVDVRMRGVASPLTTANITRIKGTKA